MIAVRGLALTLVVAAALALAACGSTAPAPPGTTARHHAASVSSGPPPSRFLQVDSARHSVTITLIASYNGTNGGFNFDGYSRVLLWKVPEGWTVHVVCTNRGELRHSCVVVRNATATTPAFEGAGTPHPRVGVLPGKTVEFSFVASRAGVYRFACLVPGHELARMYDVLQIVRHGKPAVVDLQAG